MPHGAILSISTGKAIRDKRDKINLLVYESHHKHREFITTRMPQAWALYRILCTYNVIHNRAGVFYRYYNTYLWYRYVSSLILYTLKKWTLFYSFIMFLFNIVTRNLGSKNRSLRATSGVHARSHIWHNALLLASALCQCGRVPILCITNRPQSQRKYRKTLFGRVIKVNKILWREGSDMKATNMN